MTRYRPEHSDRYDPKHY